MRSRSHIAPLKGTPETDEVEEDVQWQWSSASTATGFEMPDTSVSGMKAVLGVVLCSETGFCSHTGQATKDMLVDLNSAFSQAFAIDSAASKGSVHGSALADVFVVPAASDVAVSSPPPSAASMVAADSGNRKPTLSQIDMREKVVRELLSSERVYVDSLTKLVELFYRPLTGRGAAAAPNSPTRASQSTGTLLTTPAAVLERKDSDMLFGQIEVILLSNAALYEDLHKRLCSPDYDLNSTKISDIFTRLHSFLQVYVSYSHNYGNALKCYGVLMSRTGKTRKLLRDCEKKAGNVLEAFLILPIQRIPRYILLLQEILKVLLLLFLLFLLFLLLLLLLLLLLVVVVKLLFSPCVLLSRATNVADACHAS